MIAYIPGKGRERKTIELIDRNMIIQVKKNRLESSRKFAEKVEEDHDIKVTPQTNRSRIRDQGFQGRLVQKKPLLTKKHMKRRLAFAK